MVAHLGGVPVEEAVLALLGGGSATLLVARARLVSACAAERWISRLRPLSVHKRQLRRRTTGKATAR
jgi:hypothetical protein